MSDTRHLHVIKASAGSGKTYTLARTYIENLLCSRGDDGKLALHNRRDYHRHILAITFTNKATDEMKKRIVDSLFDLSRGKGQYIDYFKEQLGDANMAKLQENAAKALADILFNYNAFAVSTIDSFFQMLLRTFAHEIDYDSGYDLELDDKVAISTAVHDFLLDISTERIKSSDNAYRWVKEFIRDNVNNKSNWDFFSKTSKDLAKFAENINKEFFRECGEQIELYFSDMGTPGLSKVEQFRKAVAEKALYHENEFLKLGKKLYDFFTAHGIGIDDLKSTVKTLYQNHLAGEPFEPTASNIRTLKGYLDDGDALAKKVLMAKSACKAMADVDDGFKKVLGTALTALDRSLFLKNLLREVWKLGLLGVIDKKLHDNLRDNNTILLSDTGELISKIVKGSDNADNASFIYERAGTRYNNYMIDEFQDTSQKQYNNFRPLLTDSLAAGNDDLIIGDEKQSIYRFRNSDPSMLREQLEHDFRQHYDGTSLTDNWRSFAAVINFNNALFSYAPATLFSEYELLRLSYNNVLQNVRRKDREGFININFIYQGEDKKTDVKVRILDLMPQCINNLLNRGFDKRDIMILVNTRDEGAIIVKKLLESGISVVSEESLLLRNSPAIKMIINVMRFIETTLFVVPDYDNANGEEKAMSTYVQRLVADQRRYHILHEYGRRLINNNAFGGSQFNPQEVLQDILDENRAVFRPTEIENTIKRLANIARSVMPDTATQPMHLLTLVDNIIKHYVATSADDGSCTGADSTFVSAFVDEVARFTAANNGGTIREFLRYWDERCKSLSLPAAGNNAVQVMTIHKSKGLEAPAVIVPFAIWNLDVFNIEETLWIPRSTWLEDNAARKPFCDIDGDIVPPLIPVNNSALQKEKEFENFYHYELEKTLIDNLNKTYVAFTRPAQELHVWAVVKDESTPNEVHNTAQMLQRFAHDLRDNQVALDSTYEIHYDNEEDPSSITSLTIGQPETKYIAQKKELTQEEIDDALHNPVEERDLPPYFVRPVPQAISVSVENNSGMSAREEGNDMHWLMSLIHDSRDLDFAYNMAVMGNRFDHYDTERYWTVDKARDLLYTMLDNSTVAQWFAPENRVINERGISGLTLDHNRKPDRVVITPDGRTIVIDYKFGHDYSAHTINKYTRQVKEYIELLKDAGFSNIEGYLWIVRDSKRPIRPIQ